MANSNHLPGRPVWEIVGLDQMTYSKLPYPEKQKLLRRAGYPIAIEDESLPLVYQPGFLEWAVPEFMQEHGRRITFMGDKLAKLSWKWGDQK